MRYVDAANPAALRTTPTRGDAFDGPETCQLPWELATQLGSQAPLPWPRVVPLATPSAPIEYPKPLAIPPAPRRPPSEQFSPLSDISPLPVEVSPQKAQDEHQIGAAALERSSLSLPPLPF